MTKDKDGPPARSYLYCDEVPEGRIFTGADMIAAAIKDGWNEEPPEQSSEPATVGADSEGALRDQIAELEIALAAAVERAEVAEAALAEATETTTSARGRGKKTT